jgi:hypothetical protein
MLHCPQADHPLQLPVDNEPVHVCSLQNACSIDEPAHAFTIGHALDLDLSPFPHALLHADQPLHVPH